MKNHTIINVPAPYCRLSLTDNRFAYVPSDRTDVAATFRRFTPVLVCPIIKQEKTK